MEKRREKIERRLDKQEEFVCQSQQRFSLQLRSSLTTLSGFREIGTPQVRRAFLTLQSYPQPAVTTALQGMLWGGGVALTCNQTKSDLEILNIGVRVVCEVWRAKVRTGCQVCCSRVWMARFVRGIQGSNDQEVFRVGFSKVPRSQNMC